MGQGAEQSDRDCSRCPCAAPGRYVRADADLGGAITWRWKRVDRGLDQRVAGDPAYTRNDGVPVAEAVDVQEDLSGSWRPAHRDLNSGSDSHVEHAPGTTEPRVGPTAVVTDPDRCGGLDHSNLYQDAKLPAPADSRGLVGQVLT